MKKNLLLRLCLILTVAFTVYSCRTDHLPENETTYNNSNAFQFVELKDITQVAKFIKNRSGRNDLKLSLINYAAKSSINQNDINLESSDILKYTTADGVYYIFNINEIGDDNTIYTLEAKENNGSIVSAKIIEYASDANLQDNPIDLAHFNGTVSAYSLDGEKYSSVNYTEGNSNCPPVSGGGYPENPSYPNPTNPPGGTEPSFPWTPNYPGVPTPPSSPSPGGSNGSSGSGSPGGNTGSCDPNTYVVIESFTYENGDVFEVLENDCGVRYTRTRPLLNSSFENKNTTADCDDNGSGVIVLPNPKHTPCQRLKNLFDPAKANIKPLITNGMYNHINNNPTGEGGVNLKRDANGNYSSDISPYTNTNLANILTGGYYYAAIHSHPNNTYPMFSWSDIYVAYKLIMRSTSANRPHSTLLLVCEDDNGVKQTYAITFESLGKTIEATMNDIEFLGMTDTQIIDELDDRLKDAYYQESKKANPDYESVFLQFNFLTNIGLYKADSNLTNWEKLYVENGYSNAPVKSKNCN